MRGVGGDKGLGIERCDEVRGGEQTFDGKVHFPVKSQFVAEDGRRTFKVNLKGGEKVEVGIKAVEVQRTFGLLKRQPTLSDGGDGDRGVARLVRFPNFRSVQGLIDEQNPVTMGDERSEARSVPSNVPQEVAFLGLPQPCVPAVKRFKAKTARSDVPERRFTHSQRLDLGVGKGKQRLVTEAHVDQRGLQHLQHRHARCKLAEVLSESHHIVA